MEEKKIQIMDLLSYAIGIPEMKYFNLDSDELLDEKIEVLTQIKEGKTRSLTFIKCWRIYQRMICGINSQERLTGVKSCQPLFFLL